MAKGDVETYCENGRWSNHRVGIDNPFAAATGSREAMIEHGQRDAALYGVAHLIRDEDGTVTVSTPVREPAHRLPLTV
jgi:hypothetical protein